MKCAAFVDQLEKTYKTKTADGKIQVEIPGMSGRMLIADELPVKPGVVKNITEEPGEGTVSLNWKSSPTSDVEYVVYKTNLQGAFYEEIGLNIGNEFYSRES